MKSWSACVLSLSLLAGVASAQIPQSKGSASAPLPPPPPANPKAKRGTPPPEISPAGVSAARREATDLAKVNALDRYIAEQEQSLAPLYDSLRSQITDSIDAYLLGSVVLEEFEDPPGHLTVVVRVDIDKSRLETRLKAGLAANASKSDMRTLTFVFVAREQASVTQYDATIVQRAQVKVDSAGKASSNSATTNESDVRSASQQRNERATTGSQTERVRSNSVDLADREKSKASAEGRSKVASSTSDTTDTSSATSQTDDILKTSSGSSTQRAEDVQWRVSQASEINQTLTGLFAEVGYEVVEAEYLEPESGGLISIENIRDDFGSGDDMKPITLRNTAKGTSAAGIPFLVYGTLDVGLRDTDAVSGLPRVMVTVNAKAIDVRGRFPRTVSSVGPVQFSGTGANATAARSNALKLAAREAGKQLMTQLDTRPKGN